MGPRSEIKALNNIADFTGLGLPGQLVSKTIAFDGTANNGDFDAAPTIPLFTVSGPVVMTVFGICSEDLASAGGGTLSVGTALTAAGLIAQTTATAIDANEIWHDATPDASVELISVLTNKIVNQSVIGTVGTADITDGTITFYCIWSPLSETATVSAA